jgi:hypothetical protein
MGTSNSSTETTERPAPAPYLRYMGMGLGLLFGGIGMVPNSPDGTAVSSEPVRNFLGGIILLLRDGGALAVP